MSEATKAPEAARSPAAARMVAMHAAGLIRRPDPVVWTPAGEMRPAAVREIARRLRAGDQPDAIIAALGISRAAGRRKCREIASALGIRSREEQHAALVAEVRSRSEAGESRKEIAAAVGKSVHMVGYMLRRIGFAERSVGLTPAQMEEIDLRLAAGELPRIIASEVGCSTTPVYRRRDALSPSPKARDCDCGRERGHTGRCRLDPAKLELLRRRLTEGAFVPQIAREMGLLHEALRHYARPIVAQLRAQGVRCPCGSELAHRGSCTASMVGRRHTFTQEQIAHAKGLLIAGATVEALTTATALPFYPARLLRQQALAELMQDGARCACGLSIEHTDRCSARGQRRPRAPRARHNAQARLVSPAARKMIDAMARRGEPAALIQAATGEPLHRVRAFLEGLEGAGLLPAQCARCAKPYRHRGPCKQEATCTCGRRRNHPGVCRRTQGPTDQTPTWPLRRPDERQRAIFDLYRRGMSARQISAQLAIGRKAVSALITSWQAATKGPVICECGRPARHSGGCTKNTPGALGKTWILHIEDMIRSGAKLQEIADRLGVALSTVWKHSAALRAQLAAEGVRCACGRSLSHRGACTKDAVAKKRTSRPSAKVEHRVSLTAAAGAQIMAKVQAAVSRRLEPALRDDVVNELCLAVLNGQVAEADIRKAARPYTSRAFKAWQSQYGSRSLDEERGDAGLKLLDTLRDDTSPNFIDHIELGDLT